MNDAEQLRDLAAKIQQITSAHPAYSMVHERVRIWIEDLCIRARVLELTLQVPRTDDR
jgi:hypothetical protein